MEYGAAKEGLYIVFPLLFFAFLSLCFFRHEEDDGKATTNFARGCKGAQVQPFVPTAPKCYSRGDEATNPCRMQ
jgi:hypothetical protein